MIGSFTVMEASAASTVDLMANEAFSQAPYHRKIIKFGLVGSAAIADAAVELRIGGNIVGKFFNTTAGAAKVPTVEADLRTMNIFVPAGVIVQAKIVDAGATNVLAATIQFAPATVAAPKRRAPFRGKRRY